jgi:predicted phosphatase
MLLELFNTHCLLQFTVEDAIIGHYNVAFFSNLHHCTNNFIFDKEGVKTEVTKLFRELVLWNRNLTEVCNCFWRRWWRQSDVGWNNV